MNSKRCTRKRVRYFLITAQTPSGSPAAVHRMSWCFVLLQALLLSDNMWWTLQRQRTVRILQRHKRPRHRSQIYLQWTLFERMVQNTLELSSISPYFIRLGSKRGSMSGVFSLTTLIQTPLMKPTIRPQRSYSSYRALQTIRHGSKRHAPRSVRGTSSTYRDALRWRGLKYSQFGRYMSAAIQTSWWDEWVLVVYSCIPPRGGPPAAAKQETSWYTPKPMGRSPSTRQDIIDNIAPQLRSPSAIPYTKVKKSSGT